MQQGKDYFAFISYQRRDEKWADWLRKKLEHYRLPSNLRKKDSSLPKEIRPIFRDALELAGGVLAEEIQTALQQSKFLIVICSPNSAQSPWVNKEVQTFIDFGRTDRIIPFIIDGTPFTDDPTTECFPPALRSLQGEKELLGININETGREAAAVKVVARMFGLKFDALWQRRVREQKRRRNIIISSAISAIMIISYIAYWMYLQRQETLRANWEMMANQARMVAEKSKEEVRQGNTYEAIVALLEMLPMDGSRPFVAELDEALRMAYDSLQYKKWNCKYLGQGFSRICFSQDGQCIIGTDNTSIRIYDTRTQSTLTEVNLPEDSTMMMSFLSPANDTLFVLDNQEVLYYLLPDGRFAGQLSYDCQLLNRCMEQCHQWVPLAEDPWILLWKNAVGLPPEATIKDYNPVRQLALIEHEIDDKDNYDYLYSYDLYDCQQQKTTQTINNYKGKPFSLDDWTYITSTSFSPDGRKLAMTQCLGKGFVLDLDNGTTMPFDCGNCDCAHYSNWIKFGDNGQLLHSSEFAYLTIFDGQTLMAIDSIHANNYSAEMNLTGDACLLGSYVFYLNSFNDSVATATEHFHDLATFGDSGNNLDTIINRRHHIICKHNKLKYEDLQGELDSWEQTETNEFMTKSIVGFLHDNRYVLIVREGVRGSLYGVDVIDITSGVQVYHIEEYVDHVYYDPKQERMALGFGRNHILDSTISFPTLEHLIARCRELTNGMTLPPEVRRRLYLNKLEE